MSALFSVIGRAGAFCLMLSHLAGLRAGAATRTVTNLDDSGSGSLRSTIALAAAGDRIEFGVTGTITLTSGTLLVNKQIDINGPGAKLLTVARTPVQNTAYFPVFQAAPPAGNPGARIAGLTITNGRGSTGGGIRVDSGTLTVESCYFIRNGAGRGGGIGCTAAVTLNVHRCTFSQNVATDSDQDITDGRGGSLYMMGNNSILTCTFDGGNIHNEQGHLYLSNCTCRSMGLRCQFGDITVGNTLFSLAQFDSYGVDHIHSNGYNLINLYTSNAPPNFTAAGDRLVVDALLDEAGLQDNGGPVPTFALASGSPAIDQGLGIADTTDARGRPRVVNQADVSNASGGDGSDIGAFEAGDPVPPGFVQIITTLDDHDDGEAGLTDCTLREAVRRSGTRPGDWFIIFTPGLTGTIALDRNLGSLTLRTPVRLAGPGARRLAVSGGGYIRVFVIAPGGGGVISGLTIRDGSVAGGGAGVSNAGGGILNQGTLAVDECFFDHHVALGELGASGGGAGGSARGAGIFNSANLTLSRCTFTGCSAGGGSGTSSSNPAGNGGRGGDALGGAVFNDAQAFLQVNTCTFYGNSASGGGGGNSRYGGLGGHGAGGGVYNLGTLTLTSCTLSGNYGGGGPGGTGIPALNAGTAGNGNGGVMNAGGVCDLRSNLCAGNQSAGFSPAADVSGAFHSSGFNLLGSAGGATGFIGSDVKGTNAAPINPLLGTLQNNGGQMNTMLPLPGSPAIDKGHAFALSTDERGAPRPLDGTGIPNADGGDGSDVGAVEVDVAQAGPSFIVTSLDDRDDGTASALDCTLREALRVCNAAPDANTISFKAGLTGTISLTPALGSLAISGPVALTGPGARLLTVMGPGTFRIFKVTGGPASMSGLTVFNGVALTSGGGSASAGGGILNQGAALTLTDCKLTSNVAAGGLGELPGDSGLPATGGGIANVSGGTLTLRRCTFNNNFATGGTGSPESDPGDGHGGAGGNGRGGAVFSDTGCSLTVENGTFTFNTARGGNGGTSGGTGGPLPTRGAGGPATGGAIYCAGTLLMTSATLTANLADGGLPGSGVGVPVTGAANGGGIAVAAGAPCQLQNTVCAGNTAGSGGRDVWGTVNSGGYNVIGSKTGSAGFTAATDQGGTDAAPLAALLGPLQNNGGPNDTIAPLTGSPALDRGKSFGLTGDQRGQGRPYDNPVLINAAGGDGSDCGAVEMRPAYSGNPYFVSVVRAGPDMQFVVQGEPMTFYQLQYSSVTDAGYAAAGTALQADGVGLVNFSDAGPLPQRRFYRAFRAP